MDVKNESSCPPKRIIAPRITDAYKRAEKRKKNAEYAVARLEGRHVPIPRKPYPNDNIRRSHRSRGTVSDLTLTSSFSGLEIDHQRMEGSNNSQLNSSLPSQSLHIKSRHFQQENLSKLSPKRKAECSPEPAQRVPSQPLSLQGNKLEGTKKLSQSTFDLNLRTGFVDTKAKIDTGLSVAFKKKLAERWRKQESAKRHPVVQLPCEITKQSKEIKPDPTIAVFKEEIKDIKSCRKSYLSPMDLDTSFVTMVEVAKTVLRNTPDPNIVSLIQGLDHMYINYIFVKRGKKPENLRFKLEDNRIWGTVDGIDISNDQVFRLLRHKKVDDSVFEALLRKTAMVLRDRGKVNSSVLDLCSTKIIGCLPKDKDALDGFTTNMKSALDVPGIEMIWLPIHNKDHFYVAIAEIRSLKIAIFDPIQPAIPVQDLTDQVLLNILKATNKILIDLTGNLEWNFTDETGMTYFIEYQEEFPVQTDSINCCILCVAFLQRYFHMEEAWSSTYTLDLFSLETGALRAWLVAFLKS